MQKKIEAGLVSGVLNLETGRVRKWRNDGQRQRGWRERRKIGKVLKSLYMSKTLITGKKQLIDRISKKTKHPQNQVSQIID